MALRTLIIVIPVMLLSITFTFILVQPRQHALYTAFMCLFMVILMTLALWDGLYSTNPGTPAIDDEGWVFLEREGGESTNSANAKLFKIIDSGVAESVKSLVLEFNDEIVANRKKTFTLLKKMTAMTELGLRYRRVIRQDYLDLGSFLKGRDNLCSLSVQFGELIKTNLRDGAVGHLFNGMMYLTHLRLVDIPFTSDALHNFVERLSDSGVIETLELKGCGLDVNCCKHLRSFLSRNKHLSNLKLTWNSFGDEGCRIICKSLHDNDTLRSLSLRSNRISTEGFESLARLLKENDTIDCLVVSGNDASNIHLTDFPAQLERTRSLEELCIRDCNLNDACYWHMFDALSRNTSLEELRLSHISDASCACFASILIRENDTLKRICLNDINDVSGDALQSFASCLRYNTSIIEFNIKRGCTTDGTRLRLLARIGRHIWINRHPNTPAFVKKAQLSGDLKLFGSFFYDLKFVMDVLDYSGGR